MSLASIASLAVAALDLNLVQDLVGAIRAADANVRGFEASPLTPLPTLPDRIHDRAEICCDDVRERRCVKHLCCYEPCRPRRHICNPQPPLLHALPRLALEKPTEAESPSAGGASPECKPSPIQPPWEIRLWNQPAIPPAHVKVVQYRTDIISKGTLIDTFI